MPKICIDPGHGGKDPGAVLGGRHESKDVLSLGLAVGARLAQQGIEVVYTRTDDVAVSIADRCSAANRAGCDYYLSLHRDAGVSSAYGISAWVLSKADSATLAKAQGIMDEVLAVTPTYNRKVNKGSAQAYTDYGVNTGTTMPSVLFELGFVTSVGDNDRFDTCFAQYADAITRGLCKAVGVTYAAKPTTSKTLYRVQVGAFKSKDNAVNYVATAKGKGFDAFLVEPDDSNPYYRVQVGAFTVKANADNYMADAKKAGLDAFIVVYEI